MEDVFERLMDGAGVPADDRPEVMTVLRRLRTRYPTETPARLFDRARREGAPIPVPRCVHRVRRGECVACDARIAARRYFTVSGLESHSTPTCAALVLGNRDPIETGDAGGREPCLQCVKAAPQPRSRSVATSSSRRASTPVPRSVLPKVGPAELAASDAPSVGDRILWSGYDGLVTGVTERGVTLTVDGIRMTAPWGDRATLLRQRPSS